MSEFEGRPQEPEPHREKPALQLPPISDGITDEIFLETVTNRGKFLNRTARLMKKENPHLLKFIVSNAVSSLMSADVATWSFSYYEIYARSARREGLPMVRVEEDVIDTRGHENEQKKEITSMANVESDAFKTMKIEELDEEQRIENESDESDELALYWYHLDEFRDNFTDEESVFLKDTVSEVSRFLRKQVGINVLEDHLGGEE
jgi:hypothetical protein